MVPSFGGISFGSISALNKVKPAAAGNREAGLKLKDKIEEILLNKAKSNDDQGVAAHDNEESSQQQTPKETQPFTVVRVSSTVSQVTVIRIVAADCTVGKKPIFRRVRK